MTAYPNSFPIIKKVAIEEYFLIFGAIQPSTHKFLGYPVYNWHITPELIFDVMDDTKGQLFIQWIHSPTASIYNCLEDVLEFLPSKVKNKILFNLDLF